MNITSYDPRTGEPVATVEETPPSELAGVLSRAASAASELAATSPARRRTWLWAVAEALERHREELVALADRETALGAERLTGEVTRAADQLRFYGDVAVEGSHFGVTIDEATESSPGLVRVNRPLGTVAVFGASNFPFAFSVLGNDTGAALAAGCPVVAKAHEAHVGLSLRQGQIALEALTAAGAPEGIFQVVVGRRAGADLVKAPGVQAVAFTGSQAGGLSLWRLANDREVVIPVYAEMGTVNPVVVTREGAADMTGVAAAFVASFTLGHGQFCTKPGLLLAPAGMGAADAVATALRAAAPAPVMLSKAIATSVTEGVAAMCDAGAQVVAELPASAAASAAPAAVLRAELGALKPGSRLLEECFGAVVLVSEYRSEQELADALGNLQGSLAASLITGGHDDPQASVAVELMGRNAGRVVVDGWPTGVSLSWAQQHGGPWPATTVPSATSVGAAGLARFVRPVAYQSAVDSWLPPEARTANPWRLPRRLNGRLVPADEERV